MADDELMLTAQQEIDRQKRFWYLQGVQHSQYNYSWAMNTALSAISYSWDQVSSKIHKDLTNDEIRQLGYEINGVVERLENYGAFLLNSETEVWGLDRDNDEPSSNYAFEVIENYVGVGFSIYQKTTRYPKLYHAIWGCRKNGHLNTIRQNYDYVKSQVAKFGREAVEMNNTKPSLLHLYDLLSHAPNSLGVAFTTKPSQDFLAECVCQECKACCGTQGCRCRYQHHASLECEENLDDECDQNNHYQCLGCEPECECC